MIDVPPELTDLIEEIDAFIAAAGPPARSRGRQRPLLRPSPRVRAHGLRGRRDPERRVGGAARARWSSVPIEAGLWRYALPEELGGRGAQQLRARGRARAPQPARHRLAQRSAERDLDDRQLPDGHPRARVRNRRRSKRQFVDGALRREVGLAFGLTEPNHGSDATYLETTARREGEEWVIDGVKRFNSGMHRASHDLVFARTSGSPGESRRGITAFIVPREAPGLERRLLLVDVQHAHRSRRGVTRRRPRGR